CRRLPPVSHNRCRAPDDESSDRHHKKLIGLGPLGRSGYVFAIRITDRRAGRTGSLSMMSRRVTWLLSGMTMVLAFGWVGMETSQGQQAPQSAGAVEGGFFPPNGWTLTPAGQQVPLADLPLNIIPLADNRHALTATSGYNTHELTLIDLVDKTVVAR